MASSGNGCGPQGLGAGIPNATARASGDKCARRTPALSEAPGAAEAKPGDGGEAGGPRAPMGAGGRHARPLAPRAARGRGGVAAADASPEPRGRSPPTGLPRHRPERLPRPDRARIPPKGDGGHRGAASQWPRGRGQGQGGCHTGRCRNREARHRRSATQRRVTRSEVRVEIINGQDRPWAPADTPVPVRVHLT